MTGHGTRVAGIVTQIALGSALMPIKALDSDGIGQAFYLAPTIYRPLDHTADIINLSLCSTVNTRVVRRRRAMPSMRGSSSPPRPMPRIGQRRSAEFTPRST